MYPRRLAVVLLALAGLAVAVAAAAEDRTNIPLKNWGGFAEYRDRIYDDLERLALAGLTDRVLLSTKPISRIEAARMVATAIEKIRRDGNGSYNGRQDIEPVLDRLMEEFKVELASLGVRVGNNEPVPELPFVSFTPVDRAQVGGLYSSRQVRPVNGQGLRLHDGVNGGATFESRAQVGDVLTLYVQPQLVANEDYLAARLATGYLKLTLFNVELLVGRDSLWWGPALHGSLILSNNAPPLDQVRIGSAEPFLLPWVGQWVGPMKLLFFVAQLEHDREDPHTKLAGMRLTVSPFSFLELGLSRMVMFDGDNRPRLSAGRYPEAIFYPSAGDPGTAHALELRTNQLMSLDVSVRLANLGRFGVPLRDLHLYGEVGWDDTCCNTAIVPSASALSYLIGTQVIAPFGWTGTTLRAEYSRSSGLSFRHTQFTDGLSTHGSVISHAMGTDGRDLFVRFTAELTDSVMLGLQVNRLDVGDTHVPQAVARELRTAGGIDLSWRFAPRYALYAQYEIAGVKNRDFRAGDNGFEHLLRLELTRSFR